MNYLVTINCRGFVVEHLTKSHRSSKSPIYYYFFDSSRKQSLSIETFLRSILHQIIEPERLSPNIQRRVEAMIGPNGKREPDERELRALIFDLYKTVGKYFIVIDGIEEFEQEGRPMILDFLKSMQCACVGMKLFITSPPEMDLRPTLNNCLVIYANRTKLGADIVTFVSTQIEKACASGALSVGEPALLDTIKQVLIAKAEGMYVAFHPSISPNLGADL